jgi:hypothetical protein
MGGACGGIDVLDRRRQARDKWLNDDIKNLSFHFEGLLDEPTSDSGLSSARKFARQDGLPGRVEYDATEPR